MSDLSDYWYARSVAAARRAYEVGGEVPAANDHIESAWYERRVAEARRDYEMVERRRRPMMHPRSLEIDGQVWEDGDYCLDRYGTPYHVMNCLGPNDVNEVAFESPPGSGHLFHLESPYYDILRPLRRVYSGDVEAIMSIRRSWMHWEANRARKIYK